MNKTLKSRKTGTALTAILLAALLAVATPVTAFAADTYYRHGPFATKAACTERSNHSSSMGNKTLACTYLPSGTNTKAGWYYWSTNRNY